MSNRITLHFGLIITTNLLGCNQASDERKSLTSQSFDDVVPWSALGEVDCCEPATWSSSDILREAFSLEDGGSNSRFLRWAITADPNYRAAMDVAVIMLGKAHSTSLFIACRERRGDMVLKWRPCAGIDGSDIVQQHYDNVPTIEELESFLKKTQWYDVLQPRVLYAWGGCRL